MVETEKRAPFIEAARSYEVRALRRLAIEFYDASRFLKGFDIDRFVQFWASIIQSGTGVVFVLWADRGMTDVAPRALGAIGGVAYPDVNSGELIGTEFFWFVGKEHRGRGMELYEALEDWCKQKGCKQMRMMRLTDSMPALDRIYRRMGFEAAEVVYTKELN